METVRSHGLVRVVLLGVMMSMLLLVPGITQARAGKTDMTPATVRVGVFTRTLAQLAAQSKGFFAQQNLTVEYLQVTSSQQQFQSLSNNEYDAVLTSPDNVANYRLNANNPLGMRLDVQMFFGSDYGTNLALVSTPGITSVEQLRGKTVAVDSATSGFAYVLYEILRQHGLERDVDYTVVTAGGTLNRYGALLAGQFDATLLNGGFDIRATNIGYNLLGSVSDVANPYLGAVGAAREGWLQANPDVAVRFTHAFYDAVQWSFDPANREEAIQLLMTQPNTSRALAEQIYESQLQPGVGLIPDASIVRKGLYNVLKLREEYGGFDQPQNLHYLATPASGLYDLSYYRQALKDARHER